MAVTEKRNVFVGKQEILVCVSFGKDVIVFVADGAVNKLGFWSDVARADWQIRKVSAMRLRQNLPSPVDCPSGMWIELRRFIQSRSHPVVIPANGDGIHATDVIDCFYWVWTITNDVPAAEYRI